MSNVIIILAQIFGFIALLFAAWSYLSKDKSSYFTKQSISNVIFCVQYLLLGAMSGFITSLVSIAKTVLFRQQQKKTGKISLWLLLIFEIFYFISGIFSYVDLISLIPVAVSLFYTWAAWQPDLKLTCCAGIAAGILWIIYNIHVGAYVSTISSSIEIIAGIVGLIKQLKSKKIKDL